MWLIGMRSVVSIITRICKAAFRAINIFKGLCNGFAATGFRAECAPSLIAHAIRYEGDKVNGGGDAA